MGACGAGDLRQNELTFISSTIEGMWHRRPHPLNIFFKVVAQLFEFGEDGAVEVKGVVEFVEAHGQGSVKRLGLFHQRFIRLGFTQIIP